MTLLTDLGSTPTHMKLLGVSIHIDKDKHVMVFDKISCRGMIDSYYASLQVYVLDTVMSLQIAPKSL